MDSVLAAIGALVPPVGVGVLFWFVLRSMIRADRSERAAIARLDAEEAAVPLAAGAEDAPDASPSPVSSQDGSSD